MLLPTPKLIQTPQHCIFRDVLDEVAVIPKNTIAAIDDLNHSVKNIVTAPTIECDVKRLQSALTSTNDNRVAPISQHGPHAFTHRRAHPHAFMGEHIFNPFRLRHRLLLVHPCDSLEFHAQTIRPRKRLNDKTVYIDTRQEPWRPFEHGIPLAELLQRRECAMPQIACA